MERPKKVDWPYVIGLLLLPFIVMGAILLVVWVQGLTRYDPAYFSQDYVDRYAVPSELLLELETALRSGDQELLAELQGTKGLPGEMTPLPNLRFLIFWDQSEKYSDYLFMDTRNYHRYMQHLKLVDERYVRVPDGLYYLVDSGGWISTFGPIAAIWWTGVILLTIGIWVYRSMAKVRSDLFSKPPGQV